MAKIEQALQRLMLKGIGLYRYAISPFFAPCCRFWPSCSSYAQQAIEIHGPMRGCYLALMRFSKCHPWHPGGVDPVPEKNQCVGDTCKQGPCS